MGAVDDQEIKRVDPSIARLTPRELDVLELVAQKRSNRQTAHELRIGVATVRTHLGTVTQKLRVGNRWAAADWYAENIAPVVAVFGRRKPELTPREFDIVRLMVVGIGARDIGDYLHVDEWTVRSRIKDVLARFHFSSHQQLSAWFYKNRLQLEDAVIPWKFGPQSAFLPALAELRYCAEDVDTERLYRVLLLAANESGRIYDLLPDFVGRFLRRSSGAKVERYLAQMLEADVLYPLPDGLYIRLGKS